VSLRESPLGGLGPEVYLRHEILHEAAHRTCGGKLPVWAEEAAAMSFSGELSGRAPEELPRRAELDHLRKRAAAGAPLDRANRETLARLVSWYGWPDKPCAVSEEIRKILHPSRASREEDFSYVLLSVPSARVLDTRGDLAARHPPGSLLKIPYAAALKTADDSSLGEDLARSDTAKLLQRKASLDFDSYRLLVSMVPESSLGRKISEEERRAGGDPFLKQYLGERGPDGMFPLEANLRELALLLRASLLFQPSRFRGLSQNGFLQESTLYGEPESHKRVLRTLGALSKTGTVADVRGTPLVGHLMVAWPVEDPAYLAVFRILGRNGAANLRPASPVLERWSRQYPGRRGKVRVRLLTRTPPSSWSVLEECPGFERLLSSGGRVGVSLCGQARILSTARGSRSRRMVRGVFEYSPDGQALVLETDPDTYADGVLDAEAQDLEGEGRKALRAVIAWNGIHGASRHPEFPSLCDTTHCMVFRGEPVEGSPRKKERTDPKLLELLDEISREHGMSWFSFSRGGADRWKKRMSSRELGALLHEDLILGIRRERTRNGEVAVHLVYGDGEEVVPCEVFRNRLKLLSCPDSIWEDVPAGIWEFEGIGEGHGRGLSLEKARALGKSGADARAILEDAYRPDPRPGPGSS